MGRWAVFSTAVGECAVSWNETGLRSLRLPGDKPVVAQVSTPPRMSEVIAAIQDVVAGGDDDLQWVPLDWSFVSEFDREVYEATRAVLPGSTATYGQIAARVGAPRGAQAVGASLGRNPWPIVVPCHRILAADGSMNGFSAPGGTTTKVKLLEREGALEPALFEL